MVPNRDVARPKTPCMVRRKSISQICISHFCQTEPARMGDIEEIVLFRAIHHATPARADSPQVLKYHMDKSGLRNGNSCLATSIRRTIEPNARRSYQSPISHNNLRYRFLTANANKLNADTRLIGPDRSLISRTESREMESTSANCALLIRANPFCRKP